MKKIYLVDFENSGNKRLENIGSVREGDQVHIFFTEKVKYIRIEYFAKGKDIKVHKVPAGNQSLDKYLVWYLDDLLKKNDVSCSYIILSGDKGYDKIIEFWKEKGYSKISREESIMSDDIQQPEVTIQPKKDVKQQPKDETQSTKGAKQPKDAKQPKKGKKQQSSTIKRTVNSKISRSRADDLSGKAKTELNMLLKRHLSQIYEKSDVQQISKIVIMYYNDKDNLKHILKHICEDLKEQYKKYEKMSKDVEFILKKYKLQNKSAN